jgi:hypothetical protein
MLEQTNGVDFYGVNKNTQIRSSNLEIMFCGFPREKRQNLRKDGLVHSRYIIVYPIILLFLFMLTILNQTQYWLMRTN